jgi:hypothetical protein
MTARAAAGTQPAARAHHDDVGRPRASAVADCVNGLRQSGAPGLLTHLISLGFSL